MGYISEILVDNWNSQGRTDSSQNLKWFSNLLVISEVGAMLSLQILVAIHIINNLPI
jgi:hypothetical protein